MKNLFVKTDEHPLLGRLTEAHTRLETVVQTAKLTHRQALRSLGELRDIETARGEGLHSLRQRLEEEHCDEDRLGAALEKKRSEYDARVKSRQTSHASAILQGHAAYKPLVVAMNEMHDLLGEIGEALGEIRSGQRAGFSDRWMTEALYLNFQCSCELYRQACRALAGLGDIKSGLLDIDSGLSWRLGEECQAAWRWLSTVPRNPEPEEGALFRPFVPAVMLARALAMLESFHWRGGCMAVDSSKYEDLAASRVARLLRGKGWPEAGMQDRTSPEMTAGFQVHGPHPALED